MNAANLKKSERLKKLAALLSDGHEYSTLEIIIKTGICAVNSAISELRANGLNIRCRRHDGNFYYQEVS